MKDGRGLSAKPSCNFLVERRYTLASIEQEQGGIGIADRRLSLLTHAAGQGLRILVLEARGVDDPKLQAKKDRVAFPAVPRHPRLIVDER